MAKKGELLKNVPVGHAATYFQSAPPSAGSFQRAVAEAPKARGPLRLWKLELGRWASSPRPHPWRRKARPAAPPEPGRWRGLASHPPAEAAQSGLVRRSQLLFTSFFCPFVLKTLGSRSLGGSKTRSAGFSRLREIQWDGNSAPGGAALPGLVRGRRPFQRGAPRPPRRHRIPASQRKAPGLPIWAR